MRRSSIVTVACATLVLTLAGCDPRPYPAPEARTVVHSQSLPPLGAAVDLYDEASVTLTGTNGASHVIAVKIADTPDRRAHGLADVAELPSGVGMLLVFDESVVGGITIDGAEVGLDLAFVAEDGTILSIFTAAPCRVVACPVYDPEQPYHAVLEVKSGWLDRQSVDVGGRLVLGPRLGPGGLA